MLDNIKVEDVMFLDIETVPAAASYETLTPAIQNLWDKKSRQFRTPEQTAQDAYERAGIYSEFGKIICISVGLIRDKNPFMGKMKSPSLLNSPACFQNFQGPTSMPYYVLIMERSSTSPI
jgi:hypothetical protein